jgi:FkbM family methyltransferase
MIANATSALNGWKRTFHLKLRFGLSKLPLFPVQYRLCTSGQPDMFFRWTRVMPFMDPVKGAFNHDLYGWDVRELRFLRRFLAPGMTFVDIGAHHGLYSVLAAQCVGATGRVLAFEPAPPVFRRLRWHLRLNGVSQVEPCRCAVGATKTTMTLYIPTEGVDTISSLWPPSVGSEHTRNVQVDVVTLDEVATDHGLKSVDIIKLDVEGAENAVLDGATGVLAAVRPLWLFEALDSTSSAWGGSGRALLDRFIALEHMVFEFTSEGWLQSHTPRDAYPNDSNCNLLAVPRGKLSRVAPLVTIPSH